MAAAEGVEWQTYAEEHGVATEARIVTVDNLCGQPPAELEQVAAIASDAERVLVDRDDLRREQNRERRVVGVEELPLKQLPDRQLVVDGYNGRVYVNPHPDLLSRFEGLLAEDEALFEELAPLAEQPAATSDGYAVPLWVNTGVAADVQRAREFGAEGVGLYRTEVSFLLRDRFPREEEQRREAQRFVTVDLTAESEPDDCSDDDDSVAAGDGGCRGFGGQKHERDHRVQLAQDGLLGVLGRDRRGAVLGEGKVR